MGNIRKPFSGTRFLGGWRHFIIWGTYLLQLACSPNPQAVIIKVGEVEITEQHVRQKIAVENVYGNSISRCDAAVMLVNQSIEMEVARSMNLYPTIQEIAQFKNHAIRTSKAPELLKKIFKIYESDEEGLNTFFFAPKIANSKLAENYKSTVSNKETFGFDKWLNVSAKNIFIDIQITDCTEEIALKFPSLWWNK